MSHYRFVLFTILAVLACGLAATSVWAVPPPSYVVSTYAGGAWPTLPAPGTSVSVGFPQSVAPDGHGGVYFTSAGLDGVFKLDASGNLSVVFGTGKPTGGSPSPFNSVNGLAVDSAGNIYMANSATTTVIKIDTHGVSTIVASGLFCPWDVAVDAAGNLFIADTMNGRVKKVSGGTTTVVAGGGTLSGPSANGKPATQAWLARPTGLALDGAGNLFVADAGNYYVYKIDHSTGYINVVAGNGSLGAPPADGAAATSGAILAQYSLGADASGNLYIPDTFTNTVRMVDTHGNITTVAGIVGWSMSFGGDGGPAKSARIASPTDAAPDADGSLWIADAANFRVRKVDAAGIIHTVAGNSGWSFAGDGGQATDAQLSAVNGVALDASGSLLIVDPSNVRIRKVSGSGVITTVVGNGIMGGSGDGGQATSAQLFSPSSIAADSAGNFFIGDEQSVRKVDGSGNIGTVLTSNSARNYVAVDELGNLYVAEGNRVRMVDLSGYISTVAGTGTAGFSGDGGPAAGAQLSNPMGMVVASGYLYIADNGNNRIRMVGPGGIITTVAGSGASTYGGDSGLATLAGVNSPTSVTMDPSGNLLITHDQYIRQVDHSGTISTLAAGLNHPIGIAAGANRQIYFAEPDNDVVRLLAPPVPDLAVTLSHTGTFTPGQTGATYTISVENVGTGPTTAAVSVVATLPPSLTATALGGTNWNCTLATLTCTRNDALAAGNPYSSITLTVTVAADAPGSVSNSVAVSGGGETNAANDAASDSALVTGPTDLTILKMHSGDFAPGQTGAVYTITVTNLGPLTATGTVTVADTLPAKLTATAITGNGWTCTLATLTCTRNSLLTVGASYAPITVTVNVAVDAPATVVNTATVSGGGDNVPANNTSADLTNINVPADLAIAKAHIGNFTQGQTGAAYWITVTNAAGGPTAGAVTVVDTLPAGLTATGMSGAGWNCALATLTCTRTDVLLPAASYPDITVLVNVASNAAATLSNKAVVSGGGETNTSNDTALDSTTINARQDLAITKTHTGNFTQGQTGAAYTITVNNAGRAATSGTVTVVDTLPAGLTATAMSGTGWNCTLATLTCTRNDALAGGGHYQNITLTVNVASTAPASVTNTATVSGGGQVDLSDDTALDPTTIVQHPDLTITKSHSGYFSRGQTGAVYTITVSNVGTGSSSGAVTVTDALPGALTATSMAGTGWSCTVATRACSRSDALAAGASYPPITLRVNVASNAPASFTNTATVSGGGDSNTNNNTANDPTSIPAVSDLTVSSAHNGSFTAGQVGTYGLTVTNVGGAPSAGTVTMVDTLPAKLTAIVISGTGWNCTLATLTCTRSDVLAAGASYPVVTLSVNVAADAPPTVVNHVEVESASDAEPDNDADDDLTTIVPGVSCTYSLAPGGMTLPASGGSVTVNVTAGAGCAWTVTNNLSWVTLVSAASGSGSGTVSFTVAANTGAVRSGSLTIAGAVFPVQQIGASVAGARLVPVAPCRVADTRGAAGAFGGPSMADGSTRSFTIPQSACGIPATAQAYSLNVTVVPKGSLSYLTLWPAGQTKPLVSTLNSFNGAVVANAAIVPAGDNGAVSVYVSNATDVILDIDGYFDTPGASTSYSFYAALPCRVADTRNAPGSLGGPSLAGGQIRDFPVPASGCGLPATAKAYSLNVTAVPDTTSQYLGYLSIWPTGQPGLPATSLLNSWDGRIVANAAIVLAGTSGSISAYAPNRTDVILDANGYFAAPGAPGALSFYPVAPCRVADTRNATGPLGGPVMDASTSRSFPIPASGCFVPSNAQAYSVNVTVVPKGALSYLTIWPTGMQQPNVSTLNSLDGGVVANAAIVPAGTNGAVSVFVTDRTDVILDINGYFAQ